MGSVGTVFHACCLLETTTFRFHIRTLPNAPATGQLMDRFTLLLPPVVGLRKHSTFRCSKHRSEFVRQSSHMESTLRVARYKVTALLIAAGVYFLRPPQPASAKDHGQATNDDAPQTAQAEYAKTK